MGSFSELGYFGRYLPLDHCTTAGTQAVCLAPSQTEEKHLLSLGASCPSGASLPGPRSTKCVSGVLVGVWHPFLCVFTLGEWVWMSVRMGTCDCVCLFICQVWSWDVPS